jgi:hypothetical protein
VSAEKDTHRRFGSHDEPEGSRGAGTFGFVHDGTRERWLEGGTQGGAHAVKASEVAGARVDVGPRLQQIDEFGGAPGQGGDGRRKVHGCG